MQTVEKLNISKAKQTNIGSDFIYESRVFCILVVSRNIGQIIIELICLHMLSMITWTIEISNIEPEMYVKEHRIMYRSIL